MAEKKKYYLIERYVDSAVNPPNTPDIEDIKIHEFDSLKRMLEVYKKGSQRGGKFIPVEEVDADNS